jgi:acyl-coenzyme A synthetase/AMP-(fatty) acid ligase
MKRADIGYIAPVSDAVIALCQSVHATPATVNHADFMLYRHCREGRGAQPALYADGGAWSYQEVADTSARCSAWLRSLGIEPGDCVILALPDCPTLAAAYFGVVASGAVAVLLDPALPAEDVVYIAQLCEARLTIAYDSLLGRLVGLRSLRGMIEVVGAALTWTRPSELAHALASSAVPNYLVRSNPGGYAYGLLSSGSTGRPKLIVHRHQDILYGHVGFARPVLGLTAADRVISVAKMTTGYGLGCSLLMPFCEGASAALVPDKPGATVVANAIETWRCTLLFAQPRFLAELRSADGLSDALSTLRLAITGGEPLSSALADAWARVCRAELLDSYGNTEIGFLYISNRSGAIRRGSIGTPIDGLDVEVVNETGRTVRPGELGKLRVRGPSIISGYWNEPVRSAQSFHDGWFVTSDLFSVDEDGYYYIHGRADHLIKLGCGDWVNPIELEMALLEDGAVRECAVVGAPDASGLTVLRALVVLDAGETPGPARAAALADRIRDRWPLQDHKRVDIVEFTSSLPKTAAGKLDRAKLRPQSMTEFSYKC